MRYVGLQPPAPGLFTMDAAFREDPGEDGRRRVAGLRRARELSDACPDTRVIPVRDREGDFRDLPACAVDEGNALPEGIEPGGRRGDAGNDCSGCGFQPAPPISMRDLLKPVSQGTVRWQVRRMVCGKLYSVSEVPGRTAQPAGSIGPENRHAAGPTGSGQPMHPGATPAAEFRKQGLPLRPLNESRIAAVPDQGNVSDKHTFGSPSHILNATNSPAINERPDQQPPRHQYPGGKCTCPLLHGGMCPRTADVGKPLRPDLVVQDMAKFVRDGKAPALSVLVAGAAFVHDHGRCRFGTGECHGPN